MRLETPAEVRHQLRADLLNRWWSCSIRAPHLATGLAVVQRYISTTARFPGGYRAGKSRVRQELADAWADLLEVPTMPRGHWRHRCYMVPHWYWEEQP